MTVITWSNTKTNKNVKLNPGNWEINEFLYLRRRWHFAPLSAAWSFVSKSTKFRKSAILNKWNNSNIFWWWLWVITNTWIVRGVARIGTASIQYKSTPCDFAETFLCPANYMIHMYITKTSKCHQCPLQFGCRIQSGHFST